MKAKKLLSLFLTAVIIFCVMFALPFQASAAYTNEKPAGISFAEDKGLYAHAVIDGGIETEAWQIFMENGGYYYFYLPSSASASKVELYNGFTKAVTINGVQIQPNAVATVNYSTSEVYNVNCDGTVYKVKFMRSGAESAIYINNQDADGNGTDLFSYLAEDKSNSASATGAVVNPDGTVDNTEIKKIKGRGNTTWSKDKKPFNITYVDPVEIGTMEATKKFSILANYQDGSLVRNRILYDLSDAVGMPYASDSRFVDFYINGIYLGSYQMAQKIDVGKNNLIRDIDDKAYLNEDGSLAENFPFLVEIDPSASWDDYYITTGRFTLTIKAPELSAGDAYYDEILEYAKSKFEDFYSAVKEQKDIEKYADMDSLAKIYLINELGKNWDVGISSLFFVYKPDENGEYKFFGSPVWDYDNSLGNAVGIKGDLNRMGVSDYEKSTGWWVKYKLDIHGTKASTSSRSSYSNIMGRLALNNDFMKIAARVWFEDFVPALNTFTSDKEITTGEIYSAKGYYNLVKDSANMNYASGHLLDTGDWICDHSSIQKSYYDYKTGKYTTDSSVTHYNSDFEGEFNYTIDWTTSRCAWLSSELSKIYEPSVKLGDVDLDGEVTIYDAVYIQKKLAMIITFTETQERVADFNRDGEINIYDATAIQKYIAGIK